MANVIVSSVPDPANLEAFWQKMMEAPDDALRQQFVVQHLPLVRHVAARICRRLPELVEIEDLIQEGMIGLDRAVLAFDPHLRVKFSTFASHHIRGAIFDHLRFTDWVPRLVRHRTRLFEEATYQLRQTLGRSPSDHELAAYLHLSPEAFARLRKDATTVTQVSLTQARFTDDSGRPFAQIDIHPDPHSPDPPAEAQRRNVQDLITRGFDRAERLVLILYYYEQLTMKEIAVTLDLSESRVSQMHTSIIERLQSRMREQELE